MSTGTAASAQSAPGSPRRAAARVGRGTPASRQAARSQSSDAIGEEGQEPDAAPLHRAGGAEQHPRGDPPAAGPEPEAEVTHLRGRADPFADRVPVDDEAGDRTQHQRLEEHVQQADPREGEGEGVQRQEQPGEQAQQRRARQPPGQPDQDDDGEGPGDRRREPPAEGVVAEQLLAGRDEPLAQRRVDDERVAAVVLEAPGQQLVRLGRVVGLVEEQVPRVADARTAASPGSRRPAPR